jgi:hypothetical protein
MSGNITEQKLSQTKPSYAILCKRELSKENPMSMPKASCSEYPKHKARTQGIA